MSKSETKHKGSTAKFLTKSIVSLAVVLVVGSYLFDRYRIGIDNQVVKCLPWTVFLVDTYNTQIESGDYFAYHAAGMEPVVPDGQWAAKQAAAVTGDHVSLSRSETLINGVPRDEGRLYDVPSLDLDYEALTREIVVGEDQIFGMGTLPTSYDSRYAGPINKQQVIGRVYPLF